MPGLSGVPALHHRTCLTYQYLPHNPFVIPAAASLPPPPPDSYLARFHAIERSGADLINLFILPARDEWLPLLRRWKTRCAGCGAQTSLGCYDLGVTCDSGKGSDSDSDSGSYSGSGSGRGGGGGSGSGADDTPSLAAALVSAPGIPSISAKCSVLDHGAVGDGVTLDSVAIANAIAACDHVVFPGGKHFLTGTVELRSNLVLEVVGSILGAAGHIATPPPNPFVQPTPFEPGGRGCPWGDHCGGYQDYGHCYWADSLLHGNGVSNVTVMGSGTLSGNGALLQGAPPGDVGKGTKAIGLVDSHHITIAGVTILAGGWFTVLATNCEHLTLSGITIRAARDALDIMGCRHVLLENMNISGGGDDAVKFGNDWSRGKQLDSYNVTVSNSVVGSNGCNALVG